MARIQFSVGALSTSPEFPGYESVVVTVDAGGGAKKDDLTFLISKDRSSMKRMINFDLRKDRSQRR